MSNYCKNSIFTFQVVLLRLDVLFTKRSGCQNQAFNTHICKEKFKIPFPLMFLELSSDLLLQQLPLNATKSVNPFIGIVIQTAAMRHKLNPIQTSSKQEEINMQLCSA